MQICVIFLLSVCVIFLFNWLSTFCEGKSSVLTKSSGTNCTIYIYSHIILLDWEWTPISQQEGNAYNLFITKLIEASNIKCDVGQTWQWEASETCVVCRPMAQVGYLFVTLFMKQIQFNIAWSKGSRVVSGLPTLMFTERCQIAFYANIDCGESLCLIPWIFIRHTES